MITSAQLTTTSSTSIYTASGTNAITTIIFCNTGMASLSDETVNLANITVNLVKSGSGVSSANTIISKLDVPAGETVFFSEERVVLDDGDQVYVTASVANLISVTVSSLVV